MAQQGPKEQPGEKDGSGNADLAASLSRDIAGVTAPDDAHGTCPGGEGVCPSANGQGTNADSLIYALGRVVVRFPSLSVEKELAQATGREETARLADDQALHLVLSKEHNRYLARQVCWVLTIEGLETYILVPRDPADIKLFIDAVKPPTPPTKDVNDVDLVIGVRGPVAPPEMCNGLMVPVVIVDHIYTFLDDELIQEIPPPERIDKAQFDPAALDLFRRIQQMADNAGATDEHRALNYLAVRYPKIYHHAFECYGRDCSLTAVETIPSRLSGVRRIVDVVFSHTHRQTDVVEKHFVRVDVTEQFPFLVTKLQPYYER